jgi:hypothetical protein
MLNFNIKEESSFDMKMQNVSFQEIQNRSCNNKLNLNPEYQREVVWSIDRMSTFIESIMCNYYYPPIILNLINGLYICIDGKQRITSVLRFLKDEIVHESGDFKIRFSDLNDHNKEIFLNKQFQVCLYTDLDYANEVNIFRRVQNGVPMSKMEIVRSYNPELMNYINDKIMNYDSLWTIYNIDISRDRKMNYIYRCLMIEYKCKDTFVTLTLVELEKFIKKYKENKVQHTEDLFINNILLVLKFLDKNKDKLKRGDKQLKIIEFIMLYVLIKEGNNFKHKFINYFNSNTINNYNMTTYVPIKLAEEYTRIKSF